MLKTGKITDLELVALVTTLTLSAPLAKELEHTWNNLMQVDAQILTTFNFVPKEDLDTTTKTIKDEYCQSILTETEKRCMHGLFNFIGILNTGNSCVTSFHL